MEFVLKSQVIQGDLKPEGNITTIAHEFKTANDNLLKRRGRLFIVINAEAAKGVDLKSSILVFLETIQEDYFRLSDDTPMHAIEKSLNKALNDLVGTKNQSDGSEKVPTSIKIAFATTLIWNSVLYISYIGTPAVYLIRGAGVRDLSLGNANDQIWTSSSILANNDVVTIGTPTFKNVFPPNKIISNMGNLTNGVKTHPQNGLIAAIITKVSTSEKGQGSLLKKKLSSVDLKGFASNTLWKSKESIFGSDALFDKFKFHQSKKVAPVSTIGSLVTHPSSKIAVSTRIKPKRLTNTRTSKPRNKKLIAGMITLLGIGYLNYQMLIATQKEPKPGDINSLLVISDIPEVMGESDKKDLHSSFINTNHVGEKIYPLSLSTTKDKLILLSSNSMYSVDLETKEAKTIYKDFESPQSMICDDKLCYLYASEILHVLDPKTPSDVDMYPIELGDAVIDIHPYGNNVYFLTESSIYRLTLQTEKPVEWLNEGSNLSTPTSFAINGDIYVLSGRSIYRFSNGVQNESFTIDNSHLLNPTLLKSSGDYLYVLDLQSGNNKNLVVYNKNTGEFIEKIMLAERTDGETPSLFTVSDDTKLIIFKKGDYLYKIDKTEKED